MNREIPPELTDLMRKSLTRALESGRLNSEALEAVSTFLVTGYADPDEDSLFHVDLATAYENSPISYWATWSLYWWADGKHVNLCRQLNRLHETLDSASNDSCEAHSS